MSGTPDPGSDELLAFLGRFPARAYGRGDRVLPVPGGRACVGFIRDGLVRGVRERAGGPGAAAAPGATVLVAGDGRWIGADAFRGGDHLLRYEAMTPTTASVAPLDWLRDEAPRGLLFDALRSVSLDWGTAATVNGSRGEDLARRTLEVLRDLRRLHPRPDIEVRQGDVAAILGVARQTLHPVLKELEREGRLALGYGRISLRATDGPPPAPLPRRVAAGDVR